MIVRTVLSLSVSLAVAMTANAALKDGTYTEDALGHNSPMTAVSYTHLTLPTIYSV